MVCAMNKLSYEDLLKKHNALLEANIAMAKSLSSHSQPVVGLNYKIEKLELDISDLNRKSSYMDRDKFELAQLVFDNGVKKLENYEDCSSEIQYLSMLNIDLYEDLSALKFNQKQSIGYSQEILKRKVRKLILKVIKL